jgi:hypothetical protein
MWAPPPPSRRGGVYFLLVNCSYSFFIYLQQKRIDLTFYKIIKPYIYTLHTQKNNRNNCGAGSRRLPCRRNRVRRRRPNCSHHGPTSWKWRVVGGGGGPHKCPKIPAQEVSNGEWPFCQYSLFWLFARPLVIKQIQADEAKNIHYKIIPYLEELILISNVYYLTIQLKHFNITG